MELASAGRVDQVSDVYHEDGSIETRCDVCGASRCDDEKQKRLPADGWVYMEQATGRDDSEWFDLCPAHAPTALIERSREFWDCGRINEDGERIDHAEAVRLRGGTP